MEMNEAAASSAVPRRAVDASRLINLDGLQSLLGELLELSHKQGESIAQLRLDTEKRLSTLLRKVDGVEAALAARASERELRRVEHEAGVARDGIIRSVEALASKFTAAVETIDARDARRLLLLTEVHQEVKSCASASQMQRVEQQLTERASLEQLHGTRQSLEQQLRVSSDAWHERASALAKRSDAHDAAIGAHALQLAQAATAEALELAQRELSAELAALNTELSARLADARHAASAAERRLDRRADDLSGAQDVQLSSLQRLEAELRAKLGRDEAATQLEALGAQLAAARRATDSDTRTARDDASHRLGQIAAVAEAAAERAAAAESMARHAAPQAQLTALEERMLGMASREQVRAELDGVRTEVHTRAKRTAERLEMLAAELLRLAPAADGAASAMPGRTLGALWSAIDERDEREARAIALTAAAAVAPGHSLYTPVTRSGGGGEVPSQMGGSNAGASASGGHGLVWHGPISDGQPYSALRHAPAPPSAHPPEPPLSSRSPDGHPARGASACGSPSAPSSLAAADGGDDGDGGGAPLGGALSAVGLRSDLERRRRQLEERRQSIAAVRQRGGGQSLESNAYD